MSHGVPNWIRRGRISRELSEPVIEDGRRWEAAILPGGPGVRLRDDPRTACTFVSVAARDEFLRRIRRTRVRPVAMDLSGL